MSAEIVSVHMRHVRAALLCSKGARAWFKSYDLDWSRFLAEGLPSDVLEATGDPFAAKAVAAAREEASGRSSGR